MGPLDRPRRASRFVLELSWASFARFLLPKMALGAFWGCFWLVLGAPERLLRVVLASVKPISSIKTALPSFDTLFYLAVVVLLLLLLVLVIVPPLPLLLLALLLPFLFPPPPLPPLLLLLLLIIILLPLIVLVLVFVLDCCSSCSSCSS